MDPVPDPGMNMGAALVNEMKRNISGVILGKISLHG